MITGLFDRFTGATHCLAGITLGNLYWFFYGTVKSNSVLFTTASLLAEYIV